MVLLPITGFFDEKSSFDNKFMSGSFQGKVVENNPSQNITDSKFKDLSVYTVSLFKDYIKPLLESITLKNSKGAPAMYQVLISLKTNINNLLNI